MQFAADLAAWFSKGRQAGRLDVTMCPAGTVKRPKGGRPGQALVPSEQVGPSMLKRPETGRALVCSERVQYSDPDPSSAVCIQLDCPVGTQCSALMCLCSACCRQTTKQQC